MKAFLSRFFQRLKAREQDPSRLARSFAIGMFMSFSPYWGIQTWLIFPFCYLLSGNVAIAMITLYTVNNPWTMVPIIITDYFVGHVMFEQLLQYDLSAYNPAWFGWLNNTITPYLQKYFPIEEMCFWCFMIGGTIVALIVGIVSYYLFHTFIKRHMVDALD